MKKMQLAQEARQTVLDQLELNDPNRTSNSVDFVEEAMKCMSGMLPKIESIRVSFFNFTKFYRSFNLNFEIYSFCKYSSKFLIFKFLLINL